MPLITPKTNWVNGQEFDVIVDYGRIKNNIEFIREFSLAIYQAYDIDPLETYTYEGIPQVDFFNTIVEDVRLIYEHTFHFVGYQPMVLHLGGGEGFTAAELNKVESNLKKIYEKLNAEKEGIKRLSFILGGDLFG